MTVQSNLISAAWIVYLVSLLRQALSILAELMSAWQLRDVNASVLKVVLQDICIFQSKAYGKVLVLDGESSLHCGLTLYLCHSRFWSAQRFCNTVCRCNPDHRPR